MIAVAFAVGSTMTDLKGLFVGAGIGIAVNSAVALAQYAGWDGAGIVKNLDEHATGLFYNRDRLAAAAAMVAIGLVSYRRFWPLLIGIMPSLILPQSRAAWLGLLAGVCVIKSESRVLIWVSRMVAALGTLSCFILRSPIAGESVSSGNQRLLMWHDTLYHLDLIGHGLGSFREDFIRFAQAFNMAVQQSRPEHPHNEFLLLGFEGGVVAFGLAIIFAVALWFESEDHVCRGVLLCLFVLALFAMPFHDPATVILGALCAGFVAGRDDVVRYRLIDRGSALRAGLVTGAARSRAF
jgi:hypothetical protein